MFELQLLAPLITYFEEAHGWLAPGQDNKFVGVPAAWTWLTVAVYVCRQSCIPEPGYRHLVEELVFVVNE